MNALNRKGRSRVKRESRPTPRPTVQDDSASTYYNQSKEPYVNVNLQRWNKTREEWTSKPVGKVIKRTPLPKPSEKEADAERLYTAILHASCEPLPRQIPLSELIAILQKTRELVA